MFAWEVVASCDWSLMNNYCAHAGMLFLGVFLKDLIFLVWDIPDFAGMLGD